MERAIIKMLKPYEVKRIESKLDINSYIDRLRYAIERGTATIYFQKERQVDKVRNEKYTNRYTISYLFPDEDEVEVLKRELIKLKVEEYIETVRDTRFPKRSEMRVFGRKYSEGDVYIKIRVELMNVEHANNNDFVFVMSFHFAERNFVDGDFPYRKT